jgi:hypothetical protein
MPELEKHFEESRNRTGKEYREVHEWVDGEDEKKAERHHLGRIYDHIRDDVRAKMEKALTHFGI